MQINIKVTAEWHYHFLMEVARHGQSTQNKKLVVFLKHYCDVKHSDILQGSSHACCYFFHAFRDAVYRFIVLPIKMPQ